MAVVKTQNGRTITSGRMIGTGPTQAEPKYIGVGTSTTTGVPAAQSDTTLSSEVGTTRVTGTSSQFTTTTTLDTYRLTGTFTNATGGALALTQAATFDNATVGSGSINVKGDFSATATLQIGDAVAMTIDEKFA